MIDESYGSFDAAISGAGPAGSALALRLAGRGVRVALLDAARFPRDKLCGEFLSPEGALALERLGLRDELAASRAAVIRRARLTTPRGRSLEAEFPDGSPALGLGRATLDALLIAAARRAGVRVIEQARVGGPIVEDGRVVGLNARHATHGAFPLRATVCVAADGRHSALVRQTGTTCSRQGLRPGFFGLKCHRDGPVEVVPDTVALHLIPGGYVGTCRVEGGRTNLCGLLTEAAARRYRGDLDELARAEFARNPELGRIWSESTRAGPWKTVAGVRVEVSTPRIPGILYAGDGQGTVDPLGGQGMTMALLGAETLVPFVLRAIATGSATPGLQCAAQAAWHRRFDRRVRLCRLFHQLLVRPSVIDVGAALGRIGSRLLAASYGWTGG